MIPSGPFDLMGEPFLVLYGGLLAGAIVAGIVVPIRFRPAGRRQMVTDPEQLAYLAGGAARLADTVVARLLAAGTLAINGQRFQVAARPAGQSPADISVSSLSQPIAWPTIERALKPHALPIERRLVAAGLLMDADEARAMRWRQTLAYMLLLGFGLTKWFVGAMRDRPVGILIALLVITAVLALVRWLIVDRRTEAGHAALAAARRRSERLKRAPTTDEIGPAVALFGTAVLAGSGWAAFHTLRSASSGDGGDGGGSDGSGCGGGGCGGCGS